MKQIKVSEATPLQLNWLVAKCEDESIRIESGVVRFALSQFTNDYDRYAPSTDWAQGGPIIEREQVELCMHNNEEGTPVIWKAAPYWDIGAEGYGPTPLIAAVRCYVTSKLGDVVEIPEELTCNSPSN